jgi:hypothetical protein
MSESANHQADFEAFVSFCKERGWGPNMALIVANLWKTQIQFAEYARVSEEARVRASEHESSAGLPGTSE